MMLDMILSGQQLGSGILAGVDKSNRGMFKKFKKIIRRIKVSEQFIGFAV